MNNKRGFSWQRPRQAAAGAAVVALFIVMGLLPEGCGTGPSYPGVTLEGTVTINGEPIPADADARIVFMPTGSGGQASPTEAEIRDGRYKAENVPLGKVTVLFRINRLTGRQVVEDNVPGGTPYPERENLVPEPLRQGVPLEVTGEKTDQHFDLRG